MTGSKVLVAAAVTALFLVLPSIAAAQKALPHGFLGSATLNGSPAVNGTAVAALIDGRQVESVAVSGGTYPVLLIEPPEGTSYFGKTVTFTIGGFTAAQTSIWVSGELTQLNLTAVPAQATPVPATPTPVIMVGETGSTGPAGPAGLAGPQGVQGSAGPPGSGGPAGPAGAAGPAGLGVAGPQGLSGETGAAGESGGSLFGILALAFAVVAFLGTFGSMVWRWLVE